jgi:molecular chaperone DnaK (HSP70)
MKNSTIPAKNSVHLTLNSSISPEIFVVEAGKVKLGSIVLENSTVPLEMDITLEVDASNILSIMLIKTSDGVGKGVIIRCWECEDLENIRKEEEKLRSEDIYWIRTKEIKNEFEKYCRSLRCNLEDKGLKFKLCAENKGLIEMLIETSLEWQDSNPNITYDQFKEKRKWVEEIFYFLLMKDYKKLDKFKDLPVTMKQKVEEIKENNKILEKKRAEFTLMCTEMQKKLSGKKAGGLLASISYAMQWLKSTQNINAEDIDMKKESILEAYKNFEDTLEPNKN